MTEQIQALKSLLDSIYSDLKYSSGQPKKYFEWKPSLGAPASWISIFIFMPLFSCLCSSETTRTFKTESELEAGAFLWKTANTDCQIRFSGFFVSL